MNLSPLDNSKNEGISVSLNLTDSTGLSTPAIFSKPASPVKQAVILCHGFLSDKNSRTNLRLTELLVPNNIATLRFDWYGMGESPESFAKLSLGACHEQLDAAFQLLKQEGVNRIGLIGSSFGGFMALLAAPRHPSLQALGLKCPVIDFPEVLRLEFGEDGMAQWQQTGHIPNILGGQDPIRLEYSFFEELLHQNVFATLSLTKAPTLIVHGDQDELIPQHQINQLLQALGNPKQLRLIQGADHRFGHPEAFRLMTNYLTQWMIDHLSIP